MSGTVTPSSNLSSFLGSDPNLNRLYDNIQAQVPAVTLSLIKLAAWNTIEEFYLRSTSRRELVNWQMAVGVQQIDFNPFDETWLVAWILQFEGLSDFTITMPGLVTDRNQPTALRTGQALLALKPVNFSVIFPPELFSTWFETILDGTLARLYAMPAKPWSSPQLATFHGKRYSGGSAAARAQAQNGFTQGGGRWNFPTYANGRRKN